MAGSPSAAIGMARQVEEYDWSTTPLGDAAGWPLELKTLVRFILESAFPAAIVWGPAYTTIYNDAFRPFLEAKPEALGRPFSDVWSEVWGDIGPIAKRAYAGEATFIRDYHLTIDRGGRSESAWFTFCYSPLRMADGTVVGMMDTVVETTESVRTRNDLDVLNHELRHRLKNTLATVQALVRQTLKPVAESAPVEALLDRIVALDAAHEVLFREGWATPTVEEVARATLATWIDLGRLKLRGVRTTIPPRAAVSLSLILNELATNAVKHGALSVSEGQVSLSWRVTRATLAIVWEEAGGPLARPPTRLGFGTRLIDMGLAPRSHVERDYRPEGLRAVIETPLDELTSD